MSPKPLSGLELVISAEGLSAPDDFDDIKLDISLPSDGGVLWDRDYLVPSAEATLPTTFTLFAGQSPDEVNIVVTAYKGGSTGQAIVQRVAEVQVPTDQMELLYLVLAKVCEGQVGTCSSGESCQPNTGACGSNKITGTLPTYVPGQSFDAGVGLSDVAVERTEGSDVNVSRSDAPSGSGDGGSDSDSSGTGCVVDGTPYPSGAASPSNACESCQPRVSQSTFSAVADGTSCGRGPICHTGTCVSGCEIGGAYYMPTAVNPNNPCQTCQPAASTSAWSSLANDTACGNGQVCGGGQCGTQCVIGGTVYASGATAGGGCASCQPGTSTTTLTSLADGTSCGSGEVCNAGSCTSGCYVGGMFYSPGSTANDGCEVCTPGASTTAWTDVTGAATCPSGEVCNGGSCASGCSIGGTFYSPGSTANDGCELCTPGASTTAWTDVTGAASCPSGEVCNAGSCTSGCYVGGMFYSPGSTASDGCEVCTPGASTTAWTDANGGLSCNGSGTCSSGICVMPPSCAPIGSGTSVCGAAGDSCCTSLEVPAGTYSRTYTYGETSTYADPATVSGFRLDKYLVTLGRFRQFVAAWNAGYYPTNGSGIHTHLNGGLGLAQAPNVASGQTYEQGWDATDWNNVTDIDPTMSNLLCSSPYNTWTATPTTNENLPMNCVNWWESYAFCIWDGGFLPSEAEWEYAAAGGSLQLEYPWGNPASSSTTDPGTANQYAIFNVNYTGNVTDLAPVGYASLGVATWGQLDLAGEVYEWNLDWSAAYQDPCTNCSYLTTALNRVVRGGAFDGTVAYLVPTYRGYADPSYRFGDFGFRCARTP